VSRVARLGALAAVAASLLVPGSAGAANLTSGFNTGTEGWQEIGNHPTDLTSPASHQPSGGNPGGYIRLTDAAPDSGGATQGGGIISPSSWGGNRTANQGGTLSFDLRTTASTISRAPFAVITKVGGDQLEKTFATTPAPNVWTTFTVPLTPAGGWNHRPISTGVPSPATTSDFQDVLGEMNAVVLLGDLQTGMVETTDFDNISFLEPGVAPPPPAGSKIKRTVSISYKANRFRGRVKPAGPCAAGELVRIYRVRKGKDPVVGKDKTNGKGRYVVLEKNADGRYYAKVKKSTAGADTCLGAKSKTIKVG
jgi:hypothetical protein